MDAVTSRAKREDISMVSLVAVPAPTVSDGVSVHVHVSAEFGDPASVASAKYWAGKVQVYVSLFPAPPEGTHCESPTS